MKREWAQHGRRLQEVHSLGAARASREELAKTKASVVGDLRDEITELEQVMCICICICIACACAMGMSMCCAYALHVHVLWV